MVLSVGNQFVKNLFFGVYCSIPVVNIGVFVRVNKGFFVRARVSQPKTRW